MVDTWALRILVAVADAGSLSGAADGLHLSQPAVSRQIARLERHFGVALFRRRPRGVTPTDAGTTAVDLARGVLARIDALEASMAHHAGLHGGRVRVAGFASVNTAFLPTAMARFQDRHPDVDLRLVRVDADAVLEAVAHGLVDVALLTEWQLVADPHVARVEADAVVLDPEDIDGVEVIELLDEALRLALPRTHRLARRRRVPLAELRTERWVDGAYPDCLGPLPQLAEALGQTPDVTSFCDDWNGKQALVAAGTGVMVVPSLAAMGLRPDLVLRPTSPELPTRRLYVATPRPPYRTPQATALVDVLRGVAADHAPRR